MEPGTKLEPFFKTRWPIVKTFRNLLCSMLLVDSFGLVHTSWNRIVKLASPFHSKTSSL